jgi:transposase
VRFVLLPGQRYDTIGVAPLIKGTEFGGLIADKAFDANWIIAELNERGAKVVISTAETPRPDRHRSRRLQVAAPDRELLLQAERVQASSHAQRQDRRQLRSHHSPRSTHHQLTMNLNRP